ncbi:MAG: HD-GYP domain-containing protein [Actinomycetota bacterium]
MRPSDAVVRATAASVVGISAILLIRGDGSLMQLAVCAALVFFADLFRIRLTEGRPSSLGLAPGLGCAMLGFPFGSVVVGAAIGMVAAHTVRRDSSQVAIPVIALSAGVLAYGAIPTLWPVGGEGSQLGALGVVAAATAMLATEVCSRMIRTPGPRRPWALITELAPLHIAIVSAAGLFALSEPVLGPWAYPLLLAPLAATQHAFQQLAEIRRTFDQTIGALSKVPEIAGYSRNGHAQRVSILAVAIAEVLGEDARTIEDIRIAALLHDIGRMRAASPDRVIETAATDLAHSGAAIVRATGALPRVATIIERQHEEHLQARGRSDRTHPIGSRIIRVASAFDELTAPGTGAIGEAEAVRRLSLRAGFEFDPRVIEGLQKVLELKDRQTA